VTRIGERSVGDIVEASVALLSVKPGDRVTFAGPDGRMTLKAEEPRVSDAQRLAEWMMGLTPREPTPADRAKLKLGEAPGLLIESVRVGGPAEAAGLKPGDMLVQLGRFRIDSMKRLALLLDRAEGGEVAGVLVIRDGRTRIRLDKPE